jgi:hypothetical protein
MAGHSVRSVVGGGVTLEGWIWSAWSSVKKLRLLSVTSVEVVHEKIILPSLVIILFLLAPIIPV